MSSHSLLGRALNIAGALVLVAVLGPRLFPTPAAHATVNVWTEAYWNLGEAGSDFPERAPDYEEIIPDGAFPNYFLGEASPHDGEVDPNFFVAKFDDSATFEEGDYTFRTFTDDGVRLYIDDELVINDWDIRGDVTNLYTTHLSAGVHVIRMDYFENDGWATIHIDWHKVEEFGMGDSENPFLIHDCYEFQTMYGISDAHYKLANNIDCEVTDGWHFASDTYWGLNPLVLVDGGSLDGDGHTISNIHIDRTDEEEGAVGVFHHIASASVYDLAIVDADIQAAHGDVGGLAGVVAESASIHNILFTGSVIGSYENVGGLIGYVNFSGDEPISIHDVEVNVGLMAGETNNVGGLIGFAEGEHALTVEDCVVNGETMTLVMPLGGLIASLEVGNGGQVTISGNTVNLALNSNGPPLVGGLLGYLYINTDAEEGSTDVYLDDNTINSEFIVTGSNAVGGLVGAAEISDNSGVSAGSRLFVRNNVVSDGVEVSADGDHIGGLFGELALHADGAGDIDTTFSQNQVYASVHGDDVVGGLVGWHSTYHGDGATGHMTTTFDQNVVAGSVMAEHEGAGGAIGTIEDTSGVASIELSNSYYEGEVRADSYAGGLVGPVDLQIGSSLTIEDSYAAGDVTAWNGMDNYGIAGGLIGFVPDSAHITIRNSFVASEITSVESGSGAIVASSDASYTIENTYYNPDGIAMDCTDGDLGNYPDCHGVSGEEGYYTIASNDPMHAWDFSDIWYENAHEDYPTLRFTLDLPTEHTGGRAQRLEQIYGDNWDGTTPTDTHTGSSSTPTDTVPEDAPALPAPVMQPSYDGIESHYSDYDGHQVASDSTAMGISPWDATSEPISSVRPGWYIRGEHFDTVYEVVYDDATHALVRRPFWDAKTFRTYANWSDVVWVTDATLASLHMSSPMTPRPGVVLVKIEGTPATYAIAPGADKPVLHMIPDEATAVALYGAQWADYVIDIPPTMLTLFAQGVDMTGTEEVDMSLMKARATLN